MKFSTSEIRELATLKKYLQNMHADLGQLDILVEDIKCQEANRINNKGVWTQICFLYSKGNSVETIKEMAKRELTVLQRNNMARQSKCVPENNVRLYPRKKKRR